MVDVKLPSGAIVRSPVDVALAVELHRTWILKTIGDDGVAGVRPLKRPLDGHRRAADTA